ncbi:GL22077 [Drosophila persimilis]|uniref:Uncharacterized protein n=2 Tax=pseudoobscura subgroup TaxID=32358 RepID=A0A6I8UQM6_DROPS|nr:uncharacterized protein LOC4802323 [Drosophila pseudoobscura]XP_002017037.1 uncharacterized protein LOC6592177 [Drosophila persimilis]EDW34137.1 GL22077 [Drosophila persimilis]
MSIEDRLICPHLLRGRSPNSIAYSMNPNWFHQEDLLRSVYSEQDLQSECQIMGLMMSVSRSRRSLHPSVLRRVGGMDNKTQPEPTDADVVFGICDKSPPELRCGWGKSRIEWLWQLERQKKLNQAWLEPCGSIDLARSGSRTSTDIRGKNKGKSRRHQPGCWSWMRHSCGLGLDSGSLDSLDVPYCCRETSS